MEDPKTLRTAIAAFLVLGLLLVFTIQSASAQSYLPPKLSIKSLTSSPVVPGQLVSLNFTASSTNFEITTTWVDWGDGSAPDLMYNMTSAGMCQHLTNSSISDCTIPLGSLLTFTQPDLSKIVPTCAGGNYGCKSPPNGTIIVFRPPYPFSTDPNFIVVHRVVAETGTGLDSIFYTRGDANGQYCYCPSANDPWDSAGFSFSQIIGIYNSTVVPAGGPTFRYYTHRYAGLGSSTSLTYVIRITATDTYGQSSSAAIAETVATLQAPSTIYGIAPILVYGLSGLVAVAIIIVAIIIFRPRKNQISARSNT